MKSEMKKLVFVAALICLLIGLSAFFTSCAKLWEEERVEVIHPPQVDMNSDPSDWGDPTTITE